MVSKEIIKESIIPIAMDFMKASDF
jgi:hypothetical protein